MEDDEVPPRPGTSMGFSATMPRNWAVKPQFQEQELLPALMSEPPRPSTSLGFTRSKTGEYGLDTEEYVNALWDLAGKGGAKPKKPADLTLLQSLGRQTNATTAEMLRSVSPQRRQPKKVHENDILSSKRPARLTNPFVSNPETELNFCVSRTSFFLLATEEPRPSAWSRTREKSSLDRESALFFHGPALPHRNRTAEGLAKEFDDILNERRTYWEQTRRPSSVPVEPKTTEMHSKRLAGRAIPEIHRQESDGSFMQLRESNQIELHCQTRSEFFDVYQSLPDVERQLMPSEVSKWTNSGPNAAILATRQFVQACHEQGRVPRPLVLRICDQHLDLSNHGLDDCDVEMLTQYIQTLAEPVKLNASHNRISPKGAKSLVAVITSKLILELNLEGNPLLRSGCVTLCQALQGCEVLTTLNLSNCKLTDRCGPQLARTAATCSNLTSLGLSNAGFGAGSCVSFANLIKKSPNLRKLDLSWNQIGRLGALAVADVLKLNLPLQTLDLGWNAIGDDGCAALGESLVVNTVLSSLSLANNRIHDRACCVVCYGVRRNQSLISLALDGNPIGRVGENAIQRCDELGQGKCRMSRMGCSYAESNESPELLPLLQRPQGQYHCDLSVLTQKAIVCELLEWGLSERGPHYQPFRAVTWNGRKQDASSVLNPVTLWSFPKSVGRLNILYAAVQGKSSRELLGSRGSLRSTSTPRSFASSSSSTPRSTRRK